MVTSGEWRFHNGDNGDSPSLFVMVKTLKAPSKTDVVNNGGFAHTGKGLNCSHSQAYRRLKYTAKF